MTFKATGVKVMGDNEEMIDCGHSDRLVRITNYERFIILRALCLMKEVFDLTKDDDFKEFIDSLSNVFCEENWLRRMTPNTNKVKRIVGDNV